MRPSTPSTAGGRRLALAGMVAGALAVGCRPGDGGEPAAPPSGATDEGAGAKEAAPARSPTPLVEVGEVGEDFLMRQKLVAEHEGRTHRFEAVVQKRGDELSIIGLTPFGTKAFLLRQVGRELEFRSFIDREIPFPPRYVLEDVHRAFLWHVRLPWGRAGRDGESTAEVLGERVIERWSAGRLLERRFTRPAEGERELRIDYGEGMVGGRPPPLVTLRNDWYGYSLAIETPEYRVLEVAASE